MIRIRFVAWHLIVKTETTVVEGVTDNYYGSQARLNHSCWFCPLHHLCLLRTCLHTFFASIAFITYFLACNACVALSGNSALQFKEGWIFS